jgi:hypothetical protein
VLAVVRAPAPPDVRDTGGSGTTDEVIAWRARPAGPLGRGASASVRARPPPGRPRPAPGPVHRPYHRWGRCSGPASGRGGDSTGGADLPERRPAAGPRADGAARRGSRRTQPARHQAALLREKVSALGQGGGRGRGRLCWRTGEGGSTGARRRRMRGRAPAATGPFGPRMGAIRATRGTVHGSGGGAGPWEWRWCRRVAVLPFGGRSSRRSAWSTPFSNGPCAQQAEFGKRRRST